RVRETPGFVAMPPPSAQARAWIALSKQAGCAARHGGCPPTEEIRMFATVPDPIPARMRGVNRAEVCDVNFQEFVRGWEGAVRTPPAEADPVVQGSALDARGFRELFESQLISRHLDLMARVLRVQNKVFYTIGSSGHEGNAMV